MKIFKAAPKTAPVSYKLVSMILACTGGGILVPIFLNGIPVPLANDAYPIAILTSFAIHYYFPIIGEVIDLSPWVKVGMLEGVIFPFCIFGSMSPDRISI